MFVTVRERTSQIGLKKAIGAKRGTILAEFLMESAFLCIIGGLIGLLAVFILTFILSAIVAFKVFVPIDYCIVNRHLYHCRRTAGIRQLRQDDGSCCGPVALRS